MVLLILFGGKFAFGKNKFNDDFLSLDVTKKALERLKIDKTGLDETDKELMLAIIDKFNGGPVGIESIASSIGEEATTIEMEEKIDSTKKELKKLARHRIEDGKDVKSELHYIDIVRHVEKAGDSVFTIVNSL